MSALHDFLANIWFVLLGVVLILYVVLDGFDLGVGILCLFARDRERRGAMLATLAGVWDANETWLVLLAGALFGAFPGAFTLLLQALAIPLLFMLFGLVLRIAALQLRAHRGLGWGAAFGVGSLVTALSQGFALGALLHGLDLSHGRYQGGPWAWLTPFSGLVALGLSAGYALLGATYLLMKTRGEIHRRSARRAQRAAWLMMAAATVVMLWVPALDHPIASKWFASSTAYLLIPLPVAAVLAFAMLLRALHLGRQRSPFAWSLAIFVLSFLGLAMSLYPYVIPQSVTVDAAAASSKTLVFMLTGIGALMPFLLIYAAYQYPVLHARPERPNREDEPPADVPRHPEHGADTAARRAARRR